MKRALSILNCIFLLLCSSPSNAVQNFSPVYEMSLEALLGLEVSSATLSAMPLSDTPASVVIITREQIERSPARNVRDLLETYVPGLVFFDDPANGGNIRIRGIGQRNYNTILLVNGRPINQKSDQGSVAELNNWDMTDFERIEVVSGPGSVTHGPGAISGVINLITQKAGSVEGLKLGVRYNHHYQSQGVYLDYGKIGADVQWLSHVSFIRTQGYEDVKIYQLGSNGEHGYKGDASAFSGSDANPVANFYGDADDEPQVKLSVDVSLFEDWHFLSRYSSSGIVSTVTEKEYLNGANATHEFSDQHFLATLENEHQFGSQAKLKSMLSFDSENYYTTNAKQTSLDHNDVLNRKKNYSENEWFLRSMYSYQWSQILSVTAGFEYAHDYLAKPWGESSDTFRAGTSKRNFITEDSVYRGDGSNGTIKDADVVKFTDGWAADTYSLMAEMEYEVLPGTTAFLSARLDKNDYSDSLFSPRVALVSHLDNENTVKASWQKSLRMNTMIELYIEELEGDTADPEEIESFELTYSFTQSKNLYASATFYHSESQIIAWSGTESELVGEQKINGLELKFSYQLVDFTLGANHSFLQLDDWDFTAKQSDGTALQKVSLSDFFYNRNLEFLTLQSTGDSLIFWSDNTTKLWADMSLSADLILHMDARILWDMQYGDDLFDMYDKAHAQVDVSALSGQELTDYNQDLQDYNNYKQAVNDKDPFGRTIFFNAALIWQLPYLQDARLSVYGQNLINFNDNTRQKSINYGNVPVSSWIEEPRTLWLTLDSRF